MKTSDAQSKGKVLPGSDDWLTNIKNLEVTRDTEINLWSSKASNIVTNDYVYIYDNCKEGLGRIHFTTLLVRKEVLSVKEAWALYEERNGAPSFEVFKQMVMDTLKMPSGSNVENHLLKCTIVNNLCPISKTEMFIHLEGRGQIRASGRFV